VVRTLQIRLGARVLLAVFVELAQLATRQAKQITKPSLKKVIILAWNRGLANPKPAAK